MKLVPRAVISDPGLSNFLSPSFRVSVLKAYARVVALEEVNCNLEQPLVLSVHGRQKAPSHNFVLFLSPSLLAYSHFAGAASEARYHFRMLLIGCMSRSTSSAGTPSSFFLLSFAVMARFLLSLQCGARLITSFWLDPSLVCSFPYVFPFPFLVVGFLGSGMVVFALGLFVSFPFFEEVARQPQSH